jgi:hypothetical protein
MKEQARNGSLIASYTDMPSGTICAWCTVKATESSPMYIIAKEKWEGCHVPLGFICKKCACSAEQALVLWGEDGSLF